MAAKTTQIRASKAPNGNDTIVEIRLAGANSHNSSISKGQYDFGLSEELLSSVLQETQKRVNSFVPKDLARLLATRVDIIDGRVKKPPSISRLNNLHTSLPHCVSIKQVTERNNEALGLSVN